MQWMSQWFKELRRRIREERAPYINMFSECVRHKVKKTLFRTRDANFATVQILNINTIIKWILTIKKGPLGFKIQSSTTLKWVKLDLLDEISTIDTSRALLRAYILLYQARKYNSIAREKGVIYNLTPVKSDAISNLCCTYSSPLFSAVSANSTRVAQLLARNLPLLWIKFLSWYFGLISFQMSTVRLHSSHKISIQFAFLFSKTNWHSMKDYCISRK